MDTNEEDFIDSPPGGGIVKLPAGQWVAVRGGWRLWGDGVHDDTEAVQATTTSSARYVPHHAEGMFYRQAAERIDPGVEGAVRDDAAREVARLWADPERGWRRDDISPALAAALAAALDRLAGA